MPQMENFLEPPIMHGTRNGIGRGPGRWSRVLHYILAETLRSRKVSPRPLLCYAEK